MAQQVIATDSAAEMHDLIGDDATATFEADPKFIDSNPTADASSEHLAAADDVEEDDVDEDEDLDDEDDEDEEDEDDDEEDDDEDDVDEEDEDEDDEEDDDMDTDQVAERVA